MRYLILLFILPLLMVSCETEVDLFTEHGEKPVVFALLQPADSIQYFRINPTFVGEGDARTAAGNGQITNYAKGDLEVKLIDMTTSDEYKLKDSIGLVDLEPDGIFNVKNRIYYLKTPVSVDTITRKITNEVLIAGHTYQLNILNTRTNKRATSEIVLGDINKLILTKPASSKSRRPSDWLIFHTGTLYNTSFPFSFTADGLSERFLLSANYYYTHDKEDSTSTDRLVDFTIGEVNGVDAFGGIKNITIDYNGEKFYSLLDIRLEPYLERTGQTFELFLIAVGPDLDTYISVQGASLTSLSQEKPSYSNIEGGLGVFSYRLERNFPFIYMNNVSANHLFVDPYTLDLFKCARHGTQNDQNGVTVCR